MADFDKRVTPMRPDLAASNLKGRIQAMRYADATDMTCVVGVAAIRRAPSVDAPVETELLFGEDFAVYESKDGWCWGQSRHDDYVGYVRLRALKPGRTRPTHRVKALRTFIYPLADLKKPPAGTLPMNAKVKVVREEGKYSELATGGFVATTHLAGIDDKETDFVAVAERFLGVPYFWAGKTALGLDCSGLTQTALEAVGRLAPRDSDMQERALGEPVAIRSDFQGLRRGDLVFWKGHMGVMRDPVTLLHANAFHMEVAAEPLAVAVKRIAEAGLEVTSIKRL